MAQTARLPGPHGQIPVADERERFAADLFDRLWDRYRDRVEYVRTYERLIADAGATFVNDHIAFRTFACQRPLTGIASLSRLFEALGYLPAGVYHFPDKHLNAIHYQHPNALFPKLFISELKTWELSESACKTIQKAVSSHRAAPATETLRAIESLANGTSADRDRLLETVGGEILELPWDLPQKTDVETLNEESQYAAWVLVHGHNVNHYTALINSHQIETLDNIEKTVEALKAAGVPMKEQIEGDPGSKLRQSATEAVVIDVPVLDSAAETTIPWTYAYFELAERGNVTDPDTGQPVRFEGFLGPQATHLFEMTKRGGR